jgi:hypothetical protein
MSPPGYPASPHPSPRRATSHDQAPIVRLSLVGSPFGRSREAHYRWSHPETAVIRDCGCCEHLPTALIANPEVEGGDPMPDPKQFDPDPIRVALDHGEVVEVDGGTLGSLDGEESTSVVLRLAPLACSVGGPRVAGMVVGVADLPASD